VNVVAALGSASWKGVHLSTTGMQNGGAAPVTRVPGNTRFTLARQASAIARSRQSERHVQATWAGASPSLPARRPR
jgi:hypothetical protein